MSKTAEMLGRPWGLGLMLVLASWASGMFAVGILLIPTVILGVILAIGRKSWVPLVMIMGLNPLSVHFAGGIVDYLSGAPAIRSMGLPKLESFNIDPESRCFYWSGGCCTMGNEWVYIDTHNAGVRLMQHLLGPPSKSYDGPYPTKEEASRLVAEAPMTSMQEFLGGKLHVDRGVFELPPKIAKRLVEGFGLLAWEYSLDEEHKNNKIQATLYRDRCIILRLFVEWTPSDGRREIESDLLAFFDKKTGRPFAYFNLEGRNASRFPPVAYLPEHDWKE